MFFIEYISYFGSSKSNVKLTIVCSNYGRGVQRCVAGGGGGYSTQLTIQVDATLKNVIFSTIWSGKGCTFCFRSLNKGWVFRKVSVYHRRFSLIALTFLWHHFADFRIKANYGLCCKYDVYLYWFVYS